MSLEDVPQLHPALLPPGTPVGPWRVLDWVSRGVNGAVYRVVRIGQELLPPAALKLALLPDDPRFQREREDLLGNVRANEATFRATLEKLHDLPIVGDVRGDGYFYGIELVKDKETRETFDEAESERLLRGYLSKALFDAGLYCRADDRGDPVVQLAPPLVIGPPEFEDIRSRLRSVLEGALAHI